MTGTIGDARSRQAGLTRAGLAVALVMVCALVGLLVAGPLTKASFIGLGALVLVVVLLAMVGRWGTAAMATASMVIAAFVAPWNGVRLPGGVALTDGFLALAAALILLEVAVGRRRVVVPAPARRVLIGLALIAAGGLIGIVVSAENVGASLSVLFRFGVAAMGAVLVVMLWSPSFAEARLAMRAWVVGAALNAGVGFFVTFTITGRALGLSAHPNHLGLACMPQRRRPRRDDRRQEHGRTGALARSVRPERVRSVGGVGVPGSPPRRRGRDRDRYLADGVPRR